MPHQIDAQFVTGEGAIFRHPHHILMVDDGRSGDDRNLFSSTLHVNNAQNAPKRIIVREDVWAILPGM
jgi:hypothetical protein